MNYLPTDLILKDSWVFVRGEEVHLFFLADRRGGQPRCVGHAVSRNWLDWTALPVIEIRGPQGSWDDGRCGTGTVFQYDDGRYYMAYTGRHGQVEHIGLMVSDDLVRWRRMGGEPVWPRSTAAPYEDERGFMQAWRDPYVFRTPQGRWEAICCARRRGGPPAGRACVARARLDAIDRWETRPPLGDVGRYASMEVPELFELGGKWWLLFSSSSWWGTRLDTSGRRFLTGTFYLVADAWDGPYRDPGDNLLIGAGSNRADGYVARTIEYRGQRLVYHHYHGAVRAEGLPKTLACNRDALHLAPWEGVDALRTKRVMPRRWRELSIGGVSAGEWQVEGPVLTGRCAAGASLLIADVQADDVDLEASVTIEDGRRAGLAFGIDAKSHKGLFCQLDAECGEITLGLLNHGTGVYGPNLNTILDTVHRPVERRRRYRLRLLRRERFAELFVEGRLVFSTVVGEAEGGAIACFVDSGRARIEIHQVHRLRPLPKG